VDYWKPAFYLLEAAGFDTWLVNAKDVKHLPGRPKTDKLDCIWLCSHPGMEQRSHSLPGPASPQFGCGGAGGARTHDRQIMSPLL
jgi:transposase